MASRRWYVLVVAIAILASFGLGLLLLDRSQPSVGSYGSQGSAARTNATGVASELECSAGSTFVQHFDYGLGVGTGDLDSLIHWTFGAKSAIARGARRVPNTTRFDYFERGRLVMVMAASQQSDGRWVVASARGCDSMEAELRFARVNDRGHR